MLRWHLEPKKLQLRYTWKISRNSSDEKTNLFIRAADKRFVGIGEAAPNIRYGETAEELTRQYESLVENGLELIRSLEDLQVLLSLYPPANSLRFAIESAYIHFYCQKKGVSVAEFLGLTLPAAVSTAFSLPIMDPALIPDFVRQNNLDRFAHLKVKVNQEENLELVQQVAAASAKPLIVDANEAWTDPDSLLIFLEKLKRFRIAFIEQPMPATHTAEYEYLRQHTPYDIFADESVTDHADFDALQKQFHGINMKLMKAGGYLNGLHLLKETQQRGLKTMVGCMVETSLGIWSAMQLCQGIYQADLDGFLILKDEPFGIVKEKDGQLFIA